MTIIQRPTVGPQVFAPALEKLGSALGEAEAALEAAKAQATTAKKSEGRARGWAKDDGYSRSPFGGWSLGEYLSALKKLSPAEAQAKQKVAQIEDAIRAINALQVHLRALPAGQEVTTARGRSQFEAHVQLARDIDALAAALDAARWSPAAAAVPTDELWRLDGELQQSAGKILDVRAQALHGLNATPALRMEDLAEPQEAARAIGELLGDPALGDALAAAAQRAGQDIAPDLAALAVITDQATSAPDYARSGAHWGYPRARSDYRAKAFDGWDMFEAAPRHGSAAAELRAAALAIAGAADPAGELSQRLVPLFLGQIGVDPARARDWQITPESLRGALAQEAFLPLRALNELVPAMVREDAPAEAIRGLVEQITRHVLSGDYRQWRFSTPNGQRQLSALDARQRAGWMDHDAIHVVRDAGAGETYRTREENGVGLLWTTKIGGPSHGFDYGPNCLLPLLSNARTTAVLVDHSSWPHNAAARSYLRVLSTKADGSPRLYLEPMERDFPHREVFGHGDAFGGNAGPDLPIRQAQIQHALAKSAQLGVPLSLPMWDKGALESLGWRAEVENEALVVEPSAGIFEASDTLGLGHDLVQTERMVTGPLERLVVRPDAADINAAIESQLERSKLSC